MVYVPPPRSPRPAIPALDTREVAGKGKRNRRKRTTHATTVRQINAKARERQAAWREGGKPNVTYALTRKLNGPEERLAPEGLFAEHRQELAGMHRIDDYQGRTSRPPEPIVKPGGEVTL